MASTTATKQTMYITERKTVIDSKKHPGYYWTPTMDPTQPRKRMTLSFTESQIPFINNAAEDRTPLEEGIHYHYCPSKEGTFLLPNVERLQEVPVIQDDLIEDEDPPLSWDVRKDPKVIRAETFAREIAYLTEVLIKEHPSLDREDCRSIAITAFIQSQKP